MTDPITDALFNRALAIWQAFGPERAIPVEERWSRDLPELPSWTHRALRRRCDAVEKAAENLATRVLDHALGQDEGKSELARRFPALDADRLSQTWSQALYFASK